jgi:hypothetical protein
MGSQSETREELDKPPDPCEEPPGTCWGGSGIGRAALWRDVIVSRHLNN